MSARLKHNASAYLHQGYITGDAEASEFETITRYRRQVSSRYQKSANRVQRFVQLAILLALLFGVAQCARTLIVESYKLSILSHNQPIVAQYLQKATRENQLLQTRIRHASSPEGLEALARNDLNLVGDSEILVRLH